MTRDSHPHHRPAPAVFRDRRQRRLFLRDGFVVVDFGDPSIGDRLVLHHNSTDPGSFDGYYVSPMLRDRAVRRATDSIVRATFDRKLAELLIDYEPFLGLLVVKRPTGDSLVPAHQDGTCHDEGFGPGLVVWVPLTPLDAASGFLRVLPGSQKWLEGTLSTPPTRTCFEDVRDELLANWMEPVEIQPGQAIVFDSRLIHGSPPNLSGELRLAAYVRLRPAGAPGRHYWFDTDAGEVAGYEVDTAFFTSHVWGDRPELDPISRRPTVDPTQLSIPQLLALGRRSFRFRSRRDARRASFD